MQRILRAVKLFFAALDLLDVLVVGGLILLFVAALIWQAVRTVAAA